MFKNFLKNLINGIYQIKIYDKFKYKKLFENKKIINKNISKSNLLLIILLVNIQII